MPYSVSMLKKRPLKIALEALLLSIVILVPASYARAADIYSNVYGTTTDAGLITSSNVGGGVDVWYNSQSPDFVNNCSSGFRPFGGCSLAAMPFTSPTTYPPFDNATDTVQHLLDLNAVSYPITFYYCVDAVSSFPTPCTDWIQVTVNGPYVPGHSGNVFVSGGSFLCPGGRTCINSVTPFGEIATSTPFDLNAMGTLAADDLIGIDEFGLDQSKTLTVKWSYGLVSRNYASCPISVVQDAACAVPFAGSMTTFSKRVLTFGTTTQDFTESTTSPGIDTKGLYTLNVEVDKPNTFLGISSLFGFGFGATAIAATSTFFTVATSSAYERYMAFLVSNAGNFNATTTQGALNSCLPIPGYFDIRDCITTLFVPSGNDYDNLIRTVHDGILNRAPWGYITRLASILEGNATSTTNSTLPTISYTFPNLPGTGLNGLTWNIDMQAMIMAGSSTMASFTDPTSGKTFRQILEPYVLLFIALSALIIIFHDIVGIRSKMGRGAQKQ